MELTRRQLLAGAVGGGAVVGGGKAVDNVVLGYDRYTGTNLLRQDLDPLVLADLRPSGSHATLEDGRIEHDDWTVAVRADGETLASLDVRRTDPDDAADRDAELGLSDGPLEELVADLGAFEAGRLRLEYSSYPSFFERCDGAETRPFTVAALRGYRSADPDVVADFADAPPENPLAVAEGLVDGFRDHSSYDVPRYLAGSVEDNVLFGAVDLRQHFESPTDFEALRSGENDGLFCYELARRSVEAFQAVPTTAQSPPVFGGYVKDDRHKHVYTILASVLRADGDLVIPVTFLDYTHTTLYDDLRATRVLGEGLDAYGDRHRATSIDWYN